MNILNKLKKRFGQDRKPAVSPVTPTNTSMTEKENQVFGEENLSRRRLYEKWACKDYWLLFDEAMPLLFGFDPAAELSKDDPLYENIQELAEHAGRCVEGKLLTVSNREQDRAEWQVRPVDLYRWATISGIEMPSELGDLMQFVAQTMVNDTENTAGAGQELENKDLHYQRDR